MKRFLILFLVLNFNLYSQKEENINLFAKSYLDSMLIHKQTGDTIHGLEIKFNQLINSIIYDSVSDNLLIYLQLMTGNSWGGKDQFIANYSLKEDTFLWKKSFNPNKQTYFYINDQLIVNSKKETEYYNSNDYKLSKKIKGNIYYNPNINKKGIGIGYDYEEFLDNWLFGFDIKTNDTIWVNRTINMPKGIINEGILIDSQYIFFNNSMFGINIFNGQIWNYNYDFYKYFNDDYNSLYYSSGILGSVFVTVLTNSMNGYNLGIEKKYYPSHPNLQTFNFQQANYNQQCSNILFKKNKLSISLDKSILNMHIDGTNIKTINFPKGVKACQSYLFEIEDKKILINSGYYKYGKGKCSDPFIMKFSGDSIEKIKIFSNENIEIEYVDDNDFNQVKKKFEYNDNSKILGYKLDSNQIVLLFDRGLSILNFDFKLKNQKSFNKKESEGWNNLINDETYIKLNDSSILLLSNDTVINLSKIDNTILQFNYNLDLINSYKPSQIYKPTYKDADIKFLENINSSTTIVVNSKNQEIFQLANVKSVEFRNNKYYIGLGDIVYIVDKKELVK